MKKILLMPLVGLLFSSCSVDPIEPEIHELSEINSVSDPEEGGCAGADNSKTITYSEAAAIESWDEVRKLYLSLLDEGVDRGGEFDPTIWAIIEKFNDPEEGGLGNYTTRYNLNNGECQDSVLLTVTVVADQSSPACENFSAGADNSLTITKSEADAIESWDEVRKLYLSLLEDGVQRDGDFDPNISAIIEDYGERGLGDYTTEYTITEGECTDSVLLTVTVIPDEQSQPVCDAIDAGPDNSITITQSEADAIESWDEVRKLYLSLLEDGVQKDGDFDPNISAIIEDYGERGLGDYTTEYTITEGECTDSVLLTVTVIPDEQSQPVCDGVDAGQDNSMTITYSEAAAIESWDEVRKLYVSLLEDGVPQNGNFDPSISDIINRFNNTENGGPGNYTTEYTITEGECTDSVNLTIIVVPDES